MKHFHESRILTTQLMTTFRARTGMTVIIISVRYLYVCVCVCVCNIRHKSLLLFIIISFVVQLYR